MTSEVYYTDMRTETGDGLMKKTARLVKKAGIGSIDMEKKFVAIKLHFGEYGNLAYLRPNYVKVIADIIKEKGGIPFMTDSNTLYVGMRKNAVEHLINAELNGFNSISTGCQTIIADGLKGTDDVEIPVNGEYVKTAKIGRAVADADVIISLNHFKCHELTGMGGALKNLGMGCGSRRGKMEMHSDSKPLIKEENCKGCEKCTEVCAQNAITVSDKKASIDEEICVGCGRCIGVCRFDAIYAVFDASGDILNAKIVEYAKAVIDGKPNFHITVVADVSPFCDCHQENDAPVIPNVGIFASFDPVALDLACTEAAQKQPLIKGSRIDDNCKGEKPKDIFLCNHPATDWKANFKHAEKMGMGNGKYKLVKVK